jgi:hypothetical protein
MSTGATFLGFASTPNEGATMFTVDDQAAGPHDASLDHERLVLEARDVDFDWAKLPFHYVPNEPFATHVLNVLHLLLLAKWRRIF